MGMNESIPKVSPTGHGAPEKGCNLKLANLLRFIFD